MENFHYDAVVEPFVESTASGTGDQDQEMTQDELADVMAAAGFPANFRGYAYIPALASAAAEPITPDE